MKGTKTLALFFAVVLVVVCFNAPAVFSDEDHPWDGDGGGNNGTIGSIGADSLHIKPQIRVEPSPGWGDGRGGISPGDPLGLKVMLSLGFYYREMPGIIPTLIGVYGQTRFLR